MIHQNTRTAFLVSRSIRYSNNRELQHNYSIINRDKQQNKHWQRSTKYKNILWSKQGLAFLSLLLMKHLHGLVRDEATAFPQAIALAATWDTLLMNKVASAIANETKARGIRHILSPVVNIATDVRWGRVEETYGEDPFLSAAMGVAFVKAFEQRGVVTNPKHFAVNHGEGGRDSYPIHL